MAVTTVSTGLLQEKGTPYTAITDSSADWASVSNDVYFYDKTDKKVHYKNTSGIVVEQFDNNGLDLYDDVSVSPVTKRSKLRALEYIEFVDDAINQETKIQLRANSVTPAETTRFGENGSGNVDLKIAQNRIPIGDANGFATEYTASAECILGLDADSKIKEFEAVEIYNILKEEGITANKQLALLDINGNSANVKAKFEISAIAVQNTTANAVTINVGSTALGTDVANAVVIGANAVLKLPLGTIFFSTTTGQNLFISSALWNSANINIHVTISKIWQ